MSRGKPTHLAYFVMSGLKKSAVHRNRARDRHLPLSKAFEGLSNALDSKALLFDSDLRLNIQIRRYVYSIVNHSRSAKGLGGYKRALFIEKLSDRDKKLLEIAEELHKKHKVALRTRIDASVKADRRFEQEFGRSPRQRHAPPEKAEEIQIEDASLRTRLDEMIEQANGALASSSDIIEKLSSRLKT